MVADSAYDCYGDCDGFAYTDSCGYCTGGNSAYVANSAKDCNGDCDASAYIDSCGVCVSGGTGLVAEATKDCNGECDGSAYYDDCGYCVAGSTGLQADFAKDCHGDCEGTAYADECGHCVAGNTGYEPGFDLDCKGDCAGLAYIDDCGDCVDGDIFDLTCEEGQLMTTDNHKFCYVETAMSWYDAEETCEAQGLRLVTLDDGEKAAEVDTFCGNDCTWLGANCPAEDDSCETSISAWYWITGASLGETFNGLTLNDDGTIHGGGPGEYFFYFFIFLYFFFVK